MMTYNFDEIIDRSHTDCVKYERPRAMTGRDDLLPLWVADMDFATPPFVMQAIARRMQQSILGYPVAPAAYNTAIQAWVKRQFELSIEPEHIHFIPGVVPGVCYAIQAFTQPGDGVLIQPPVYYPFRQTIEASFRKCITNDLTFADGKLSIDFEDFEAKVRQSSLFILCHPHNPIGQEWEREDLERMADICHRHGVPVVSDEIHADMLLGNRKHLPFAMVSPKARDISITFMAPSKVFNMPGVVSSYSLVFDEALRRRFYTFLDFNHIGAGNVFSYDCTIACYSDEGDEWRRQMLAYVERNMDFAQAYLAQHCPKIKAWRPQASFLMWLDCRQLPCKNQDELLDFFINEARLFLNDGCTFGQGGQGFMRLNVASPQSVIAEALGRLKAAYEKACF